jgi:endoglucanase
VEPDTPRRNRLKIALPVIAALIVVAGAGYFLTNRSDGPALPADVKASAKAAADSNPLKGKKLYVDGTRSISTAAVEYERDGSPDAALLREAASQPGSIWLTGPTESDPSAQRDLNEVMRTSTDAASQQAVPVYQLYAIPNRDACAEHSKGGFASSEEYLRWVDSIITNLKSPAVFSIEADAIAQSVRGDCMSKEQIEERYRTLESAVSKLSASSNALAVYLDAGHSEWFPDPTVLVEPLKRAGINKARGIAVNVSFFVATPEISDWALRLASMAGSGKGVIIDTSRNGNGVPPADVTGESRWCNPSGRAIGDKPSTTVRTDGIDAYIWIKNVGESDGSCGGHPPAGTFEPSVAIELARNATP